MRRAALYARFSSELQNQRSIDDQLALCRSFCVREGFAITAEYSDRALSGATVHGRPGLAGIRADVRQGKCDVVVVEDFDRLSRGMGDLPKLWEEMQFAGVELIAVNEGVADQIRIGVRGILGAVYLTDLRNKTKRGLEGKLRLGMRAGGLPYGYRPILGRPGEHEVFEPEALIVRRIFEEYADGATPRTIAYGLNRDRVPPMRGRAWNASTINGSAKRASGILTNDVYRGEIVWNKVGKMKNPATGKRVPKINPPDAWRRVPAPHLRIVDDALFEKVGTMKTGRQNGPTVQRRGPQRLLSGLLKCSECGSSIVAAGSTRGYRFSMCTRARESGSCSNARRIFLHTIERAVIDGLREHLAHPELIGAAVRAYHAEMQRLEREANSTRAGDQRRLTDLQRSLDRMVEAIAGGEATGATLGRKIAEAEAEVELIQARLAAGPAPDVVALHPKAVDRYLTALDSLAEGIRALDDPAALTKIRELVDSITVYPRKTRKDPIRFDIKGKLAALLNNGVGLMVPRGGISHTHSMSNPLFLLPLTA
jgi:site-specific DNA recombinase